MKTPNTSKWLIAGIVVLFLFLALTTMRTIERRRENAELKQLALDMQAMTADIERLRERIETLQASPGKGLPEPNPNGTDDSAKKSTK